MKTQSWILSKSTYGQKYKVIAKILQSVGMIKYRDLNEVLVVMRKTQIPRVCCKDFNFLSGIVSTGSSQASVSASARNVVGELDRNGADGEADHLFHGDTQGRRHHGQVLMLENFFLCHWRLEK